jgi:tetratricopeptide (TPR) repeat protein
MRNIRKSIMVAASVLVCGWLARGQGPLAGPLAEFDKLVSQLKAGSVVGEPIRAGDTAVVPFAKIRFGLGAGGGMTAAGGGMRGATIPMGVVIVEGDEVRAEMFPEQEEKPSVLHELVQAILDRKLTFMVNGLNIGNSERSVEDLAPLIAAMMGQTTIMTNGLNLGNLNAPRQTASSAGTASPGDLAKLIDARRYPEALKAAGEAIDKDPKNAEAHAWKGRILGAMAQGNPADMAKYGAGAREEFEKALALDPKNRNALFGRGIGRLMAPPAFGGDPDGAIADFEAVAAGKPSPEAYYYLGEAYRSKGLKDKAAAAYRKALELKPNDAELLKALAGVK